MYPITLAGKLAFHYFYKAFLPGIGIDVSCRVM